MFKILYFRAIWSNHHVISDEKILLSKIIEVTIKIVFSVETIKKKCVHDKYYTRQKFNFVQS